MPHDATHLWKKQFFTLLTCKCSVCLDSLPRVGVVYKCRDCDLIVHSYCLTTLETRLDMPLYFKYNNNNPFLDIVTSSDLLSGWVKLWQLNKWQSTWIKLDANLKLSLYDTNVNKFNCEPFFSVTLQKNECEILDESGLTQTEFNMGKKFLQEDFSCLIKIKFSRHVILIITSTPDAKKKWINIIMSALNSDTKQNTSSDLVKNQSFSSISNNRFNFITSPKSHFSGVTSNFSYFFEIKKSEVFEIYCSEIFDNKWLLIGAKNGFFFTNAQNPLFPIKIAGVSSIYFMEVISEYKVILIVCENIKLLAIISFEEMRRALKLREPRVDLIFVENIMNCNVTVVSKPEHNEKRDIFVATNDSIIILKFEPEKKKFLKVTEFKIKAKCTTICSTPLGFIFGADNFYFVKYISNFIYFPLYIENFMTIKTIAAVQISCYEYLLAFQEFGIFVTADGKKTRLQHLEWTAIPRQLYCTASNLYIIYDELIEGVRIASDTTINSPMKRENRSVYKHKCAYRIGRGLNLFEELFAVSLDEKTNIYVFYTQQFNNSSMSIFKNK